MRILLFLSILTIYSCTDTASNKTTEVSENQIAENSAKANAFFDEWFDKEVKRFPEWQTYLGIKDQNEKWNDNSEEYILENVEFYKSALKALEESIKFDQLNASTQLSYKLFKKNYENKIEDYDYRHYNYPVNQMRGAHTQMPSFLSNMHKIANEKDARDYISRLNGIDKKFEDLIKGMLTRQEKGIMPPKFVLEKVIKSCNNVISGQPFNGDKKNSIFKDFNQKLSKIELTEELKTELVASAKEALLSKVKPAYLSLISTLEEQLKVADDKAGVWKFPEGEKFYNRALRKTTTTALTWQEIHEIGLSEVSRIHEEMKQIIKEVNFEGDLQEFFEHMRTSPEFYFPQTPQGIAAYMTKAKQHIGNMKGKLDELFLTKPKAELIVKKVEEYREAAAGKAFYQSPAPDGSRPGTYYANMFDMAQMPKYQMEALAYHEAIPGHHMQLSIAQEMDKLPKFRRFDSRFTAYVEGWGLYSEFIPKEIGFYKDPYSDFGRLAMELWRACRLVVDTGIHGKKWNRQKSIEYYQTNTPNAVGDCVKMVDRHIVMPSQATAYKIGMLKLLELRQKTKSALGERFDIKEFHEVVLTNGAVPLDILEDLVDQYIALQ